MSFLSLSPSTTPSATPSFVSAPPNYAANFKLGVGMNIADNGYPSPPYQISLSGDGHRMITKTSAGVLTYFVAPLGYTQLGSSFTVTDYYPNRGVCNGSPVIINPTSFALSGDGETAVVGMSDDSGAIGAQWIFVFDGVQFVNQGSKIIGSNYKYAQYGVYQGSSVAISNDGNTVISGGTSDANNVGAVWVFKRSGVQWSEVGKYSGTENAMYQGSAVAISGDGTVAFWNSQGNINGVWVKPLASDGMFFIKLYSSALFFQVSNDGRRLVTGGGVNDQNQLTSLDLDLVQLEVVNSQQISNSSMANNWYSQNSFAMNSDGTVVAFPDNAGYLSVYVDKDNEWSLSQHTTLWYSGPSYRCSSSQQIALDASADTMILSYNYYCYYNYYYNSYSTSGKETAVYSNHPLPPPSPTLVPTISPQPTLLPTNTIAPTNTSQFTTSSPSTQPTTISPSAQPTTTSSPSFQPTTHNPSLKPVSVKPTMTPAKTTTKPSIAPTRLPSQVPVMIPTRFPTTPPTKAPQVQSVRPTRTPSQAPTAPTRIPSHVPIAPQPVPVPAPVFQPQPVPQPVPVPVVYPQPEAVPVPVPVTYTQPVPVPVPVEAPNDTPTTNTTQVASVKPINELQQSSFGPLSPVTLAMVIVFSVFGVLLCAFGIAFLHKKRTDDIVKTKQFVDWLGVNDSNHVNTDSGNTAIVYQNGAPIEERASLPMNYRRNNNNNNNSQFVRSTLSGVSNMD